MRKSAFRSNKKYFHINLDFQTQNLFRDLDWIFVQKKVSKISKQNEIEVQSLVMMDTHIHMLIATFEKNENYFCENLQQEISTAPPADNSSEPILNYSQYLNTYKYIYRNPVEALLCSKTEEYPHSSLRNLLGRGVAHCEIHDQLGLIQNPVRILTWLNQDIDYKVSQLRFLRPSGPNPIKSRHSV